KDQPAWMPALTRPEQVRTWTKTCMQACVMRGQMREAAEVLRKLVNDPKAAPEDVAWAKRTSTLIAASGGGAAERRLAVMALKNWKPDADAALEDLRTYVASLAVAARHLYGSERKQMLQRAVDTM